MTVQIAYVPYAHILKFLKGEQGDTNTLECLQKLSKSNGCQATNYQKPLQEYVINIYDINLFNFFYISKM
jgi:hypothetical protein